MTPSDKPSGGGIHYGEDRMGASPRRARESRLEHLPGTREAINYRCASSSSRAELCRGKERRAVKSRHQLRAASGIQKDPRVKNGRVRTEERGVLGKGHHQLVL